MPLFRFGTSPADTTPILITNQELNSNGYDLFKGTVGYEDTITLADNLDGTLLLQPNVSPPGPNARTLWVKNFAGTTVLSADIATGQVIIPNLIVSGTASINLIGASVNSAVNNLTVTGIASINSMFGGNGVWSITGTQSTVQGAASWARVLILDVPAGSTDTILEFRGNGLRHGSLHTDTQGNMIVNGGPNGGVFLAYDEGGSGTFFGSNQRTTVGFVDTNGKAVFNSGVQTPNASVNTLNVNGRITAPNVGPSATTAVNTVIPAGPIHKVTLSGTGDSGTTTVSLGGFPATAKSLFLQYTLLTSSINPGLMNASIYNMDAPSIGDVVTSVIPQLANNSSHAAGWVTLSTASTAFIVRVNVGVSTTWTFTATLNGWLEPM
jgi:hypothetical protein